MRARISVSTGPEGLEPPTAGFGDRCSTKLSYGPIFSWPGAELNRRHRDFQSRALPTELPGLALPTSNRQKPTGPGRCPSPFGPDTGRPGRCRRPDDGPLRQKRRTRRRSGLRCSHSGGGIRTRDLRVMSPMSYQTAPPRSKTLIVSVSRARVNSDGSVRIPVSSSAGPDVRIHGAPRLPAWLYYIWLSRIRIPGNGSRDGRRR